MIEQIKKEEPTVAKFPKWMKSKKGTIIWAICGGAKTISGCVVIQGNGDYEAGSESRTWDVDGLTDYNEVFSTQNVLE